MPQAAARQAEQQLAVEPLLMLLQEDLRRELRQATCQALLCNNGVVGGADAVEAALVQQEQLFVLHCWPLGASLVQQVEDCGGSASWPGQGTP